MTVIVVTSTNPLVNHTDQSDTFPFAWQFSAARGDQFGRASAAGTYSAQVNGQVLQFNGTLSGDSVMFATGYAQALTSVWMTVDQPTTVSITGSISIQTRGVRQDFPVLPGDGGAFEGAPSEGWMDPPLAQGYTFTNTGHGLFKQIMAFPSGIPASYSVITEGQTYGPFTPADSVDFEALRGHGVSEFVVKGIKPFVDATNPVAFPIQLAFTEATADFTMIPIAAPDIQMETLPNGDLQFTFDGVLQSSPDLTNWTDVTPTAFSPYVIPKAAIGGAKFFRSREP